MWRKLKRLKEIVWDESGIPKFWAAISPFIPGAIQWAKNTWPMQVSKVKEMIDLIQWWWGIPIAIAWVIWALARKIFEYETPVIEQPTFYQHGRDWYMELRARGKGKFHVVVNFEVHNEDGSLFLPTIFGYLWNETHSNPIGIHGGGNQRTVFARYVDGMARIFGTNAASQAVAIDLPKGSYTVVMSIHDPLGANITRKVKVLNDSSAIHVS